MDSPLVVISDGLYSVKRRPETMGKYMDQYNDLLDRKNRMKHLHNRLFSQYGHLMSEEAKVMNKADWDISEQMYDRDIARLQKLALKEIEDEAVERIMKRISVEVQDNASKPLQDLDKHIKNLFSK